MPYVIVPQRIADHEPARTSSMTTITISTEHYDIPMFEFSTIQIDDGVTCSSAVKLKQVRVPEDGLKVRYFDAVGNDLCPPTFVYTTFWTAKAYEDEGNRPQNRPRFKLGRTDD